MLTAFVGWAIWTAALAQAYPAKPIRVVVPFAPGGASDSAARVLGRSLSTSLGQPVVIDNRPGANGVIAAQTVVSAAPDGHTLLWTAASMVAIPLVQKSAGFDSLASLSPVSLVGELAFGMFVHPGVPARTVPELVHHVQANSRSVLYASATLSEFLAAVQFMNATGTNMMRVPYKGGAQALPDLVAGRVQVYFTPIGIALPYARDTRLRVLAILLPQRSPAAPDVPTMLEAGPSGVAVPSWQALLGPPKTPAAIVARLSEETVRAVESREVRQQFEKLLMQPQACPPLQLASVLARDLEIWRRFIRENDIPVE